MTQQPFRKFYFLTVLVITASAASAAWAQSAPPATAPAAHPTQDLFEITVAATGRAPYRIAVADPYGTDKALGAFTRQIVANDLRIATAFKVLKRRTYPAIWRTEGMAVHRSDWRRIGAQGVMKFEVNSSGGTVQVHFALWELSKGEQAVLEKTYRITRPLLRITTHVWCNAVMKYYTGRPGAFGTRIAFVATLGPTRKDIFVMQHDGYDLHRISKPKSINILPSWSPNGRNMVFTSYVRRNPDLYMVPVLGRHLPHRVSKRIGLNAGAAFSPDGKKVAITMTKDGNPEIYVLSRRRKTRRGWRIIRRLTSHPGIDTSPTWSPDGRKIVWVSNRYGNPQLWIMNADGSHKRRLTRRGYYNQTPAWCPRKGSPLIAFTSRRNGHFSVFIYNVRTHTYRRITGRRHGDNEEPTWAPNCELLAFSSTRGGIWVSNLDGTAQTQIYKGKALQPRWGPWPTLY